MILLRFYPAPVGRMARTGLTAQVQQDGAATAWGKPANPTADMLALWRPDHTGDSPPGPGSRGTGDGPVGLPFFTSENVAVGDEKLTCSVPIKLEAAHYAGPYSVRLLVGADARWIARLHRSVHDIILVDPASSPYEHVSDTSGSSEKPA